MGGDERRSTVASRTEGPAEMHNNGQEYSYDKRDMKRLGKQQELKRRFRFASIVGYVVILGLTWEFSLVTGVFSLANGGTAGAIWLTLIVCSGMLMCVLSMAELASMAPTSGGEFMCVSAIFTCSASDDDSGQYHWVRTYLQVDS
nr:hypothetical protein CFP56_11475 [Quercus suber]